MKKTCRTLSTTVGLVSALFGGLVLAHAQSSTPPSPGAAEPNPRGNERHPAIHRAIVALEAAKTDLKRAEHDFGGHRAAALEQCDKAIGQLKLALQYDKK